MLGHFSFRKPSSTSSPQGLSPPPPPMDPNYLMSKMIGNSAASLEQAPALDPSVSIYMSNFCI